MQTYALNKPMRLHREGDVQNKSTWFFFFVCLFCFFLKLLQLASFSRSRAILIECLFYQHLFYANYDLSHFLFLLCLNKKKTKKKKQQKKKQQHIFDNLNPWYNASETAVKLAICHLDLRGFTPRQGS